MCGRGKEEKQVWGIGGAGHPLTVPGNASALGQGQTMDHCHGREEAPGGWWKLCGDKEVSPLVCRQEDFGLDE